MTLFTQQFIKDLGVAGGTVLGASIETRASPSPSGGEGNDGPRAVAAPGSQPEGGATSPPAGRYPQELRHTCTFEQRWQLEPKWLRIPNRR